VRFAAFREAADGDDDLGDELVVAAEFGDELENFRNDLVLNVDRFVFVVADYQIFYLYVVFFWVFFFDAQDRICI
jgi:hypothetical protein